MPEQRFRLMTEDELKNFGKVRLWPGILIGSLLGVLAGRLLWICVVG